MEHIKDVIGTSSFFHEFVDRSCKFHNIYIVFTCDSTVYNLFKILCATFELFFEGLEFFCLAQSFTIGLTLNLCYFFSFFGLLNVIFTNVLCSTASLTRLKYFSRLSDMAYLLGQEKRHGLILATQRQAIHSLVPS